MCIRDRKNSLLAYYYNRQGAKWPGAEPDNKKDVYKRQALGFSVTADSGQILHGIFLQKLYNIIHDTYLLVGMWGLELQLFSCRIIIIL